MPHRWVAKYGYVVNQLIFPPLLPPSSSRSSSTSSVTRNYLLQMYILIQSLRYLASRFHWVGHLLDPGPLRPYTVTPVRDPVGDGSVSGS